MRYRFSLALFTTEDTEKLGRFCLPRMLRILADENQRIHPVRFRVSDPERVSALFHEHDIAFGKCEKLLVE